MADEPAKKSDWAIPFLGRLCLIGWLCAIFYETFHFFEQVRTLFLLFGFWSCSMALVYSLALLFIRRNGIFLVFVLVSILPTVHFGLVLRNIAVQKKIIDPSSFGGESQQESKDEKGKEVLSDRPTTPETPAP